jgi:excisionase family DNA binding protein
MNQVQIYTADQAAELMGCSVKTVEDLARRGELPGIKPGGGWIFPAGALAQRLDELAIEQAAMRRKPAAPSAITAQPTDGKRHRQPARQARALPKLVDMASPA